MNKIKYKTLYKLLFIIGMLIVLILTFLLFCKFDSYRYHQIEDKRDIAYEQYCDSIYQHDYQYYVNVLSESDEYIDYISTYGEWWDE